MFFFCSRFDSDESTNIVNYVTQLCCVQHRVKICCLLLCFDWCRFDSGELTNIVIYVTQLCCMPFAFDISDVLLINIQRYLHVTISIVLSMIALFLFSLMQI